MGSVMLTKKRYVGYMYEHIDQDEGVFDAKGIETVRRDTCPIVSKTMKKMLLLLFRNKNVPEIQRYVERQLKRILNGKLTPKDFIFAKEVRLGSYAAEKKNKNGTVPPAAIVSKKAMALDPMAEPRYAERVPYVVINGPPGSRLVDLVISPELLLSKCNYYTLNTYYYCTKQVRYYPYILKHL